MLFLVKSRAVAAIVGIAAITMMLAARPLRAQQENPAAPTRATDTIKPQPVCQEPDVVPVSILAPPDKRLVFEMLGPVIRTRGGMIFQKGRLRITASEGEYNTTSEEGHLKDVSFTTCCASNPDYHITAREATLLPNHMLRVRDVSLYLGHTRLLMLPWMRLQMGGRNATANVFPRIGYDGRDGVTLSQTFRVTDTTRSRTNLDLTFTTSHSLEGYMKSRYGIGGKLTELPGRYLTYGSMRARALEIPQPPACDCDPQLLRPKDVARLQPFGVFTIRQRTYDAQSTGLVVYRQPEVGATYVGPQLSLTRRKLDPRIEIYPQITASDGRFKETPGHDDYLGRRQVAAEAGLNTVWLGPNTSIQPLGTMTWAHYGNGQTFRTWGAGIDVAHITRNGSFLGARYISRTSSGSTPFIFDNIDIHKEIDLASQLYVGKKVFGLGMTYDADNGTLFDWSVIVGQRSDCLATYAQWDNRYRRFSLDVALINM